MAKRKSIDFSDVPRISRQEAYDAGETYYFTADPCNEGHTAPRFTANGHCVVCRRTYWRNWMNNRRQIMGDEYRRKIRQSLAKDPVGEILRGVKARANKRGIKYSLERSDISIPENCPCCSRKLNRRTGEFKKGAVASSPSLDRIKPKLGYVSGNVVVICFRCNALKSNATLDELETVVRWMKGIRPGQLKLVV